MTRQEQNFGEIILAKLNAAFAEIMKKRAAFLEVPNEAESIHQLRISIRTYRSLLSLLKPALEADIYLDVQSLMRKCAQQTARLREIDVLTVMVEDRLSRKVQPDEAVLSPTDKRGLKLLKNAFNLRRLEEEKQCLAQVSAAAFAERIERAHNVLTEELSAERMANLSVENLLIPRLDAWFLSMLHRMEDYREFNLSYIHRTRLKAKKARYVSELFSDFLNEKYLRRMKEAKALQSELGDVCDVISHQELIMEILFPTVQNEDRSIAMFTDNLALKRAAKRLVLAEKELELSLRETLHLKLWLSSVGPI